ncbi:RadC family protein [Marinospirillum alkaliphilum]|uniref:DNA replication and repair protein RadC n=1 Tax=Marinospirillum alkaliphilum DSM 21637 TaxID=1122209 RepID=A0A1K1W678_9GAMM|nr:DNA repair protein RadC [Marinospirillum alkaliphilum]SFX32937.1 DNA replication and repair protein RadC [Marinospirillum alkaliphilum DSM 21637]
MGINHWPEDERPREKLLQRGAAALSDAELLAIFLRTGVSGKSAVDLARHLLQAFGGLRPLLQADQKEFCQHLGLGQAKFAQLQAVLEMAHRHLEAELKRGEGLTSPEAAGRYLKLQLRDLPHEVFALLLLDNQHRVLHFEILFRGTLDGASVYPREVVKLVLAHNAAAVIFAHNHPSGIAEPSKADELITRRLKEALASVDVRVLDHLIIGDGEPVSFVARGLL